MLIIVEGILSAGNLMGALIHPIELSRPEKLVYSGHIYPFSPIISDLDYPLYKSLMHTMQVSPSNTTYCLLRRKKVRIYKKKNSRRPRVPPPSLCCTFKGIILPNLNENICRHL